MHAIRVYDLPTRAFHWLFAGFFITAFSISNLVDDESARFSLHMLAGLGATFVIVLRLAWSFFGTQHARLGDLALKPSQLAGYFKGMFSGSVREWAGHNPASSWAAVAMVAMALGLATTGILMATGKGGDSLKEAHELMANTFLVVVLLHLGGVALHVLRRRDRLYAAMVSGNKQVAGDDSQAVASRPIAGLAFVLLTGLFAAYLWQNYDAPARTLALFGQTLQLGEDEHEEGSRGMLESEHERGEHDD